MGDVGCLQARQLCNKGREALRRQVRTDNAKDKDGERKEMKKPGHMWISFEDPSMNYLMRYDCATSRNELRMDGKTNITKYILPHKDKEVAEFITVYDEHRAAGHTKEHAAQTALGVAFQGLPF